MLDEILKKLNESQVSKSDTYGLYRPEQEREIRDMQTKAFGGATGAMQTLSDIAKGGFNAQDAELVRDFQQNLLPQLTQGFASSHMMGSSGAIGAQSAAGAQLASQLASQGAQRKYDASQSLLDLYTRLGTQSTIGTQFNPNKVSPLESLLDIFGKGAQRYSEGESFWNPSTIGGMGTTIGGLLGGGAGAALGGLGGYSLSMLLSWLRGKGRGAK